YKEAGKKVLSNCLYAQMPETIDTVFAKEVSQNQSEKQYKQKYESNKGKSSYSTMKQPPDIKHAMEVNKHQSDVSYKKDTQAMHTYTEVPDRPDIKKATESSKFVSNVEYKTKYKADITRKSVVLGRPDIEHAKKNSKLVSQVKYREQFDKEMKGKKHQYNPLECTSFKQAQAAAALASDVRYKGDLQKIHDFASEIPTSLHLDHALKTSKMQSNYEYKREFESSKGHYHLDLETAEQLHHKENAVLQSQVKYKEKYEKSKGKSMLEFVDTPAYQVSKEAQKIQSQKEYRKDFEEGVKGKPPIDIETSPVYLHAKYVASLLNEKEYKRDLEEGIKGKGLTALEDMPDLIRIRKSAQMLSEKEYKRDLEMEIKGKGMEISSDILDIKRAKEASRMASQNEYKKDLETVIKGKGMQISTDTPDMRRAKRAYEIASQTNYKQLSEMRQNTYGTVTDTPAMLHAMHAKNILSQKKYKDEAAKLLSAYSTVADTPEMQRVKNIQNNVSAVLYKDELGAGTAVTETPEMERVKKSQQNISTVSDFHKFKERTIICDAIISWYLIFISDPCAKMSFYRIKPRAHAIQSLSTEDSAQKLYRINEYLCFVKYKEGIKQATAISDLPEMARVKENQKNISNVRYKEQVGKGTAVSITPEMERVKKNQENVSLVKYAHDVKEMKGRPSLIIDTPEMRRVKETQNNISMVKYHEDFEKTRGRGFTQVANDPVTERVRKNAQFLSDAAYKGVHPHVVEMDRRPGIFVAKDLKVWRTDPGSIFDFDPVEDNIQSRSLHMLSSGTSKYELSAAGGHLGASVGENLFSDIEEISFAHLLFSCEYTRTRDSAAPVLPGAYQQSQSQGYGYMHQTSMSSMRSMHSQSHSHNMRTYRAMYDYTAQDDDEVSFRDGDIIINVQQIDEGWMFGTVQRTGKAGMLPANYIESLN
uniref:Nebulette n=1 Tax=Latimeria chalumnae TaxID=7897 RepID=H3B0D0_LATCH